MSATTIIRSRLARAASTLALSAAGAIALCVTPALAFDGRVPDGRSATPAGEIESYYWHGLDRDPDPSGRAWYGGLANDDCRKGLLDAGASMLDSAEANRRWPAAEQKAGVIYASLLNRPPDPGGFQTQVHAIRTRGMRWTITSVQASAEFNARLDRLCAGRRGSTAKVLNPGLGIETALGIYDAGRYLTYACGASFVGYTVLPIKLFRGAGVAIQAAKFGVGMAVVNSIATCHAAYQAQRAAKAIARTVDYEGLNNPVFVQIDQKAPYWTWSGRWCEKWIHTGPNAASRTTFHGKFRC